ncbi:MAG TPA: hypothetical protein VKR22_10795 [Acidimicrobiales bacterium]|nr:hypothetical protein [Acidimicrobiales bacterium]
MRRDESGASLLIALVFVVAIAVLLIAIVNLSGTNLTDTAQLQNERALEYSADAVVDTAIQADRYVKTPVLCTDTQSLSVGQIQSGGVASVVAYCDVVSPPSSPFHQATIVACLASISSFANCTSPILTADVEYTDQKPDGTSQVGYSLNVISWNVNVANG